MSLINCQVEKKYYETAERLINRFNKLVNDEAVLKDHRLNVILTKKERKQFKKFAAIRRTRKKGKRIQNAIKS